MAQQVLRPDVRGVRRRVERGGTTAANRHALDSSLPRRNVRNAVQREGPTHGPMPNEPVGWQQALGEQREVQLADGDVP